ncbi:HAMP domain-containing sensor histidine kinase [Paenibacillus sp. FSL W8-0426]|uniref:sensor histidine kinase n=1 Tax=Paenibacillus sp. FSL W8-0426 TaxID=2921714 RepID=UPI0030DACAD6
MKKEKWFDAMLKSAVWFAAALSVVIGVFVLLVLDVENQTLEINHIHLTLLFGGFGACCVVYSLWSARRVTRPLERIASAIQGMKEGEYGERLIIDGGYEFEVIQKSFNEMAEVLERAREDNRKLEREKRQMLADLSHDLKTPITIIQGYAKALELDMVEGEENKVKTYRLMYGKAEQVTAMIDQIVMLSKLDRPDYPLMLEHTDIAELTREVAAEFYELFELEQYTLEVDCSPEHLMADCDLRLMHRAMSNLLTNAMKHNPPGTKVTIELAEAGEFVSLAVADNGVGIPANLTEVIFDPFVRGDAARTEDGGTGLGLSIVRQIAELHRGTLHLNGASDGTRFELLFPKSMSNRRAE